MNNNIIEFLHAEKLLILNHQGQRPFSLSWVTQKFRICISISSCFLHYIVMSGENQVVVFPSIYFHGGFSRDIVNV